ncbi:sugar transferase [Bacillus sp. SD075]|uniref:sugar transferase n=1 Tax=Bacillus sp. SD075 TaxID=2781732 RepID=UPI002570C951|nr:sugar transferase [Bacillus sp. SD075]MBO0996435.1 sugar transferase [Bacillus sp. SD075]
MKPYLVLKRIFDLIFALTLLIIISPILIIVAIVIKLESRGPVFFLQDRLGRNGRTFKIYKLRSMIVNAEKIGTGAYSYKGDPRVTKVGAFIRKTSIDELPQLFNIIKGEMSVIGPRPTLLYHPWPIEEYTEEQKKRFDMRPGVTGLAQVNGRKEVPWLERIKLDVEYVNKVSLWVDTKIFFKTIIKVLFMGDNYNTNQTASNVTPKDNISKLSKVKKKA